MKSANVNRLLNALNIPIRILLVLALLAAIANAIYFFGFAVNNKSDAANVDSSPSVVETRVRANDIIRAELFGAQDDEEVAKPIEETTLNLRLTGILFNAAEPELSFAIIKQGNRSAEKFKVGDRIAGVAELTEIHEDRVIITRAGQQEWLAFEKRQPLFTPVEETSFLSPEIPTGIRAEESYITQQQLFEDDESPNEPTAGEASQTSVEWLLETLEKNTDRLQSDPDEVLEEWGLTQVSTELAKGYRLNETMASRVGLRAGDVVVAVNGQSIGNVVDDLTSFKEQLDSDSVEVEVRRGAETMLVKIKN